ncbi:ECF sigma factor [Aquisphaera giovannonii]|uniref:ECF sigma factor n=1 Tax=Aquisphaera giovannonii TaxID=406548 RepID=A0A5B9W2P1_9BACT|nr:ECF-type sigma factor [Aquisphaera giovannonii]QEH34873.1 ECF sigma factor [Aquisphaera giovannonii]
MNNLSPVRMWVSQLREGDPGAAQELWNTYFLRMVGVARGKLGGLPGRMADEEDVALSAFKSFCRGTRDGRFPQLVEAEDPWPLLLALTKHKAVDLVRHESRAKRGGAWPSSPEDVAAAEDACLSQVPGNEPDPHEMLQVAEACQSLLDRLSDTILRAIAEWRLEGFTTEEIARKLGFTPRTIERKLQLIRRLWKDGEAPR